ncbi:MAG: hypothetical protein WKF79_02985 [Nocardioides sp.]
MPGGNDYGEPKTPQHRRGTQSVLNESWPLSDKDSSHARGIEDHLGPTDLDPTDVEVRIEWADDGEQWLPGRAHCQVVRRSASPRGSCA